MFPTVIRALRVAASPTQTSEVNPPIRGQHLPRALLRKTTQLRDWPPRTPESENLLTHIPEFDTQTVANMIPVTPVGRLTPPKKRRSEDSLTRWLYGCTTHPPETDPLNLPRNSPSSLGWSRTSQTTSYPDYLSLDSKPRRNLRQRRSWPTCHKSWHCTDMWGNYWCSRTTNPKEDQENDRHSLQWLLHDCNWYLVLVHHNINVIICCYCF
jgi:hypothetical protein